MTLDDSKQHSPTGRTLVRHFTLWLLGAAGLLIVSTSVVLVDETEVVIVDRLGHIVEVYDRQQDRGLHFKLPWPLSSVRRFDRRTQLFDPPGREIFTRDKKNITVDAYVSWRIAAPQPDAQIGARPVVRFFRAFGNRQVAESRLDSRVRSILSTEIGQVELSSLLNVTDPETGPAETSPGVLDQLSQRVRQHVVQRPEEKQSIGESFGIEIVDVRLKRINFPLGNQQAVFERMKSERRKIADRYRHAGMAENTVLKSQADRQYKQILAKADADAERIRGAAEAEAVAILNRAHAEDPEFYRIIRTLDTYRTILNERSTLVLSASSSLLQLLTDGIPDLEDQPEPRKDGTSAAMPEGSVTGNVQASPIGPGTDRSDDGNGGSPESSQRAGRSGLDKPRIEADQPEAGR